MKTFVRTTRITPEERESHLWYDPFYKTWTMETNIPKHFNKALKVGWEPILQGVYEDGTVCCMTLVASERGITIKTPKKREMSEEHKAKIFGTKNVDLDDNFEDDI